MSFSEINKVLGRMGSNITEPITSSLIETLDEDANVVASVLLTMSGDLLKHHGSSYIGKKIGRRTVKAAIESQDPVEK